MARGGKRPGAGRPKGVPNKLTASLKETIIEAFENAGGAAYLRTIAIKQPAVFCALLGKLLPHEITGKDGQPLVQPTINVQLSEPGPAPAPKAGNGATHPRH